MRSGNPVLKENTFNRAPSLATGGDVMTLGGTVNKSFLLLAICFATAMVAWNTNYPYAVIGGAIGGLILALIISFKPTTAPFLSPFYAAFEGVALGAISSMFEARYPGIVIQAVGITFGVFFALLMAYKSNLIRATENFKLGVVAATGGVMIFYLAGWIASMFGYGGIAASHAITNTSWMSIGISLVVCVIAALNLVLDFDFIESGAKQGAPKYMEWYGAFGLLVTLVWLYLEILRLLAKTQSRR